MTTTAYIVGTVLLVFVVGVVFCIGLALVMAWRLLSAVFGFMHWALRRNLGK